MAARLTFAQKTAQRVEFAGFGPCVATAPRKLVAHCQDIHHEVALDASGLVEGRPWPLLFQKPVPPEVTAVLSVIEAVWGVHAGLPLPIHDTREWEVDEGLRLVCRYLWRHEIAKPDWRLVLTELHVDGRPFWFTHHHMTSENREAAFHYGAGEVLKQFMEQGRMPEGFERARLEAGLKELES